MLIETTGIVFDIDESAGNPVAALSSDTQPEATITVAQSKAGVVAALSFSGTPKKAVVVFSIPFLSSDYAIAISGEDARIFSYESKDENGFTINSNAGAALTGETSWVAVVAGD